MPTTPCRGYTSRFVIAPDPVHGLALIEELARHGCRISHQPRNDVPASSRTRIAGVRRGGRMRSITAAYAPLAFLGGVWAGRSRSRDPCYGSTVSPYMRYLSTPRAALRPSWIAHTTSD